MRFRFLLIMVLLHLAAYAQTDIINRSIDLVATQTKTMLDEVREHADSLHISPRTLTEDGGLELVRARDWTSGFFAGILWQLYAVTEDPQWATEARIATAKLEDEKWNGRTHDMGFKIYCSYGNGYEFTGDTAYRAVTIHAARTLAARFNPVVGAIRSWDHNQDRWGFPVIIDNMLNLELLFAATRFTGDSTFYHIAVSHANTTLKNHFRADVSTYHVIDYNPVTGEVEHRHTHQGYNHASTWARGQAWALYGYTMCYRETGDTRYLEQAIAIAQWLIAHPAMPDDGVPFWDFNAPRIPHDYKQLFISLLANCRQFIGEKDKVCRKVPCTGVELSGLVT